MKLRYAEPDLHVLDKERAVCLVLTAFSDDRPLQGLAGRVDWRLNGQLSRLMRDTFIDAHYKEAMLTPIASRLPFGQLLFVGMGERAAFNEQRFAEVCRFAFTTLARLGVTDFAMALPGRIGLDVGLRQAIRGWEEGIAAAFSDDMIQELDVCLIESVEVQRELIEPLRSICQALEERATASLSGNELRVDTETAPTEPQTEVEEGFSAGRRRDWSTGMFRIVEETAAAATTDLETDEEEIGVAEVPKNRRRSGLFTIPSAQDSATSTRASGALRTQQSGHSGLTTGPSQPGRTERTDPSRGSSLAGGRRPSGQFAAVRRGSGQYDAPTRRPLADFNAPPVAVAAEPVTRSRRDTTQPTVRPPSGAHRSTQALDRQGMPPRTPGRPRPEIRTYEVHDEVRGVSQVAPQLETDDSPWGARAEGPPTRAGVHVEPPLLQTGQFDEAELTDAFHRRQQAQHAWPGEAWPTAQPAETSPRADSAVDFDGASDLDNNRGIRSRREEGEPGFERSD